MTKISAYLNLFDDWDILEPAIASFADRVDEIVVVDGAYRWMLPYFNKIGRDPARSLPPVYDILAKFGEKIRIVNGIWENEVEKRIAGYEACDGRYRYRTDADEIFFFDDAAVASFFTSGLPVAQMDMPLYAAPGLIAGEAGKALPRQSFLFDSAQLSARDHLAYLWLVLPEWERAQFGKADETLIFPTTLAFNAHLTHWRPPSSSLSRARFYVMNYFREHGAPAWASTTPGMPVTDFNQLFEQLPPQDFDDILLGRPLVVIPAGEQLRCRPTPLTATQNASFAPLYARFLDQLAALNTKLLDHWRCIARGEEYVLDATRPHSLPTGPDNSLTLLFSEDAAAIKIEIASYYLDPARNNVARAQSENAQSAIRLTLPPLSTDDGLLRRTFSFTTWSQSGSETMKFRLHRDA